MLSTVHSFDTHITVQRKRPSGQASGPKRDAQRVFGHEHVKKLQIPVIINEYNHHMNGVDVGDQLRANSTWQHAFRRGAWQPLAWGFLLNVCLVNSFILFSKKGTLQGSQKSQIAFRKTLIQGLFNRYGTHAQARQRARRGHFIDKRKDVIPVEQHTRGNRGKRSRCVVCKALHAKAAHTGTREPLGDITNSSNGQQKAPNTRWGCITCDVAVCNTDKCWYMYHNANLVV